MERVYTVPLRKEFQKAPKYKYASKAMRALKQFLIKHMKSENIKIGKYLNQSIWKNGPKNPPAKVKINVIKDKENVVTAELVDAPEEKKVEPIKEKVTKNEKEQPKEEIPKASELKKEEETKEIKKTKVPTAKELAENKNSKK
jgi:large subunit ribosomal protein L31e